MAALVATVYATISCRFVVLTYTTNMNNGDDTAGSFEEYFNQPPTQQQQQQENDMDFTTNNTTTLSNDGTTTTMTVVYRTSVGLYQWLRPLPSTNKNSITDWTVGTCVGYQQTMLAAFQSSADDDNIMFDLSRIMAIFAILLGVFQFSWMFLSSCMSMNRIQMYLFIFLTVCGTAFTGLTFLFHKSTICTTEFGNSAYCQIDQGGLVMIAAVVLWFITFLISIYYVAPVVRVISTTDSIDFELHKTRTPEEKQKLALQREIYKELRRQQKEQRDAAAATKSNMNHTTNRNLSSKNHSDDLPLFITPRKPPQSDKDATFQKQQQIQQSESTSKRRSKASQHTNPITHPAPVIRNSYSYDSKESWLRPIPKRSNDHHSLNPKKRNSQHFRSMSMEDVPVTNLVATSPPFEASSANMPQQQQQQQRPSSLSRLMLLPLSLPRRKLSEDSHSKSVSSSLSKIIVEPQETGDIEMQQPEHDTKATSTTKVTTSNVLSSSSTPISVPLAAPATNTTSTTAMAPATPPSASVSSASAPTLPRSDATSPAHHDFQSNATTGTTKHSKSSIDQLPPPLIMQQPEKNPVDVYIAQRLDNIEMLTRS
jgi:hypothetical protein